MLDSGEIPAPNIKDKIVNSYRKVKETIDPKITQAENVLWQKVGRDQARRDFINIGETDPDTALAVTEFISQHFHHLEEIKLMSNLQFKEIESSYKYKKKDAEVIKQICNAIDNPIATLEAMGKLFKIDPINIKYDVDNMTGLKKLARYLDSFEDKKRLDLAITKLASIDQIKQIPLDRICFNPISSKSKTVYYESTYREEDDPLRVIAEMSPDEFESRFSDESMDRLKKFNDSIINYKKNSVYRDKTVQPLISVKDLVELTKINNSESEMQMYIKFAGHEIAYNTNIIKNSVEVFQKIVGLVPELITLHEKNFNVFHNFDYSYCSNDEKLNNFLNSKVDYQEALENKLLCDNAEVLRPYGYSVDILHQGFDQIDFIREIPTEKLKKAFIVYEKLGNRIGLNDKKFNIYNFYSDIYYPIKNNSVLDKMSFDEVIEAFERFASSDKKIEINVSELMYGVVDKEDLKKRIEIVCNPIMSEIVSNKEFISLFDNLGRKDNWEEIFKNSDLVIEKLNLNKENFSEFIVDNKLTTKFYVELLNILETNSKTDKAFRIFDKYSNFLREESKNNGFIDRKLTDPFIRMFRRIDNVIPENSKEIIDDKIYDRFNVCIENLVKAIDDGPLKSLQTEMLSKYVLTYLARQPERFTDVFKLPTEVPKFFEYLDSGPLMNVRGPVLRYIFGNGDVLGRSRVLEATFTSKLPLWIQLFVFTDSIIGKDLSSATTEYPIREIPKIVIDKSDQSAKLKSDSGETEINITKYHTIRERSVSNMSLREKRAMLSENVQEQYTDELLTNLTEIPFADLKGIVKKTIWLDRLRKTVDLTRDENLKKQADIRNREYANETLVFTPGTCIHGAPLIQSKGNVLDYMLTAGNLPGEALGDLSATDSYPFQIDLSVMTQKHLDLYPNTADAILHSISGHYGVKGDLGETGQMWLVYQRNEQSYDSGIQYLVRNNTQSLILGGLPSTEISAIVLNQPNVVIESKKEAVVENVTRLIVENGFYIPIYDISGKLLFTTKEYDQLREQTNCQIPIEIIDYNQKIGEQMGSNPGGTFLIPVEQGMEKSYLKFENHLNVDNDPLEGQNRIWNEYLADSIYQIMGISVPETKIVRIRDNNIYAHSSKWLNGESDTTILRNGNYKDGAVVDWLLANWDIQLDQNLKSINEKVYRLDNGGALLYRAQGERKSGFGPVVTEIESMKSSYPDLTESDIRQQINKMNEVLTDNTIDKLIESTRLKNSDRESLKLILEQRRDYINSYFSKTTEEVDNLLPSEGESVANLIADFSNQRETIISEIPEMAKAFSKNGYQHNGVLLGDHIVEAVTSLIESDEYHQLNSNEKVLANIAIAFHDLGKPIGPINETTERDFKHEIPSANLAAEYMRRWGFSNQQIMGVVRVILNDGIVSDIARDKIRNESKQISPQQFASILRDKSALRIIRAVNKADVVATVGTEGYSRIQKKYKNYFIEAEKFFNN